MIGALRRHRGGRRRAGGGRRPPACSPPAPVTAGVGALAWRRSSPSRPAPAPQRGQAGGVAAGGLGRASAWGGGRGRRRGRWPVAGRRRELAVAPGGSTAVAVVPSTSQGVLGVLDAGQVDHDVLALALDVGVGHAEAVDPPLDDRTACCRVALSTVPCGWRTTDTPPSQVEAEKGVWPAGGRRARWRRAMIQRETRPCSGASSADPSGAYEPEPVSPRWGHRVASVPR